MTLLSHVVQSLSLLSTLVGNEVFVGGVIFPLVGTRRTLDFATHGLTTRAGVVDLQNSGDLEYHLDITLGGRSVWVLVDSGSADFWIAGDVPEATGASATAVIHYQDDLVRGPIMQSTLDIGGVEIANQSYVAQAVDASHPDGQGILGIGPTRLSSIATAISAPGGNTVIDNLIALQGSGSEYITTLISRSANVSDAISAQLTVGEVLPDFQGIRGTNQLDVTRVGWDLHWAVSLDEGGIVGPDDKIIKASEGIQLRVVFDSGYTLSQVPGNVAEAIYSRVPGANLTTIDAVPSPVWTMPCDFELNITLKFGGVDYSVHPLDTVTSDVAGTLDAAGNPICVGAFQPSTSSNSYDILLGLTFLRNAYLLMNIGSQPYVQLLSLTNPIQAHQDFVQQRLGGVDMTGTQQLLPDTVGLSDISKPPTTAQKYKSFIVAGTLLGVFILLCGLGILTVWCRKRRYQRLHTPAPEGVTRSRGFQSSAWNEFTDPESKAGFKGFSLRRSSRPRSLPPPPAREPMPNLNGHHHDALQRKQHAGDLMPNRRPSTQIFSATQQPSSEEAVALLGNDVVVDFASRSASRSSESFQNSQERELVSFIGEKPLPEPHESELTSQANDVGSPLKHYEDEQELPLTTPATSRRYTYSEPQTPATPRAPARADTPDPYSIPPMLASITLTSTEPPKELTSKPRPLPIPSGSSPNCKPPVHNANETISHQIAVSGRSKMDGLPRLDTSGSIRPANSKSLKSPRPRS